MPRKLNLRQAYKRNHMYVSADNKEEALRFFSFISAGRYTLRKIRRLKNKPQPGHFGATYPIQKYLYSIYFRRK